MSTAGKVAKAIIQRMWQETPTVKGLQLKLEMPSEFNFQPGQWVNFYAPGLKAVGGYSICTTPAQLQQHGTLDLCVKVGGHPCAKWVHEEAAPSTKVNIQVGGSFVLLPCSSSRPCLFVAGGIGITALASMVLSLAEQQQTQHQAKSCKPLLLYSAASPDEFALLRQLIQLQQSGHLDLQLHTTKVHGFPAHMRASGDVAKQQQPTTTAGIGPVKQWPQVIQGRIGKQDLASALQHLQDNNPRMHEVEAYLCGPPKMADDIARGLCGLGLPEYSVHTERWW